MTHNLGQLAGWAAFAIAAAIAGHTLWRAVNPVKRFYREHFESDLFLTDACYQAAREAAFIGGLILLAVGMAVAL